MRALVLSIMTLAAAPLSAQCAEGRTVGPETEGRCCWPAQRWNGEHGRCEGPPSCPSGWGAEGDACVRASADGFDEFEDPSAYDRMRSSVGSGPIFEDPGAYDRPSLRRPEPIAPTRASIRPLWISGLVLFSIGYLYSVVSGFVFEQQCCGSQAWAMFIPIAGGLVWPAVTNYQFQGWAWGFGVPSAAVQISGVVLLLLGIAIRRPVRGPRMEGLTFVTDFD